MAPFCVLWGPIRDAWGCRLRSIRRQCPQRSVRKKRRLLALLHHLCPEPVLAIIVFRPETEKGGFLRRFPQVEGEREEASLVHRELDALRE